MSDLKILIKLLTQLVALLIIIWIYVVWGNGHSALGPMFGHAIATTDPVDNLCWVDGYCENKRFRHPSSRRYFKGVQLKTAIGHNL